MLQRITGRLQWTVSPDRTGALILREHRPPGTAMQTSVDLRLARHGVIVLLLGLLTGFVIARFHNRGAGDAAHLVGLIGGFGTIALALLWPKLQLRRFWSETGVWATAACMYLNWLGVVLLGAFGSGPNAANPPLLGSPLLWDRAGGMLLKIAIWLSLLATLIILFGLRKPTAAAAAKDALSAAPSH